jgi:hypothetical protein
VKFGMEGVKVMPFTTASLVEIGTGKAIFYLRASKRKIAYTDWSQRREHTGVLF